MSRDSDYWQGWIAPLLTFLAADASDQLDWASEHQVKTAAVAEEFEFSLHLARGMADRGTFEPEALQDLKAIGRLVGETDGCGHVDRWADTLAANATWGEVRTLARRILVARLGEWRQPLPRRVLPQHVYD
ncbi:hypothetical protein ACFYO5_37550 [Streptomyces sp. NPDC006259]|uniref:hypothetical protein n=1 Tax=Streptomyces sp. NPDC006259 TaxID=3364740 RepID=UPI003697C856